MTVTTQNNDRLIDVYAVASKLDCDPRTVYRLAKDHKMPWGCKCGSLRRWYEKSINEWMEGGCKAVEPAVEGGGQ